MIQIQENRRNGETLTSICEWYWGEIREKLELKINSSTVDTKCIALQSILTNCKEFLENNLKELITGNPEDLLNIYNEWIQYYCTNQQQVSLIDVYTASTKKKLDDRSDEEREIISFIQSFLSIFDYDKLLTQKIKYELAQKLDVKVCPYCNRNYTLTVQKRKTKKSRSINTRPDFDHFFSKSKHPILALSFYNLIPSCSICNRTLKGDVEFSLDIQNGHVHPYLEGFPEEVKFNYDPKSVNESLGIDDACKIKLDYDENTFPKVKNNDDVFGLNVIYAEHGDIAAEIIAKFYKTNGRYLEVLATQFNDLNKEELYRIAFANYLNKEDFEKRPMAKLTKDIYDQLASIYSVTN